MKITLLNSTALDVAAEAAGICRNADSQGRAFTAAINAGHESLLEHIIFQYKIENISRVCSHQLVRHRIASPTQASQRAIPINFDVEWYVTPAGIPKDRYAKIMNFLADEYTAMLEDGIPLEDARYILPGATHTSLILTINARSLMNFFRLRLCVHAQQEIRTLATNMFYLARTRSTVFSVNFCEGCVTPCEAYGQSH